jgi:hypothetical protein
MFLLYLDEFGHSGKWDPDVPAYRHHPLFGLAGFAIEAGNWKDFDRGYLRLKRQFYFREVRRALDTLGVRPERYEPKRLRSRRDHRFTASVLKLIRDSGGTLFACGRVKQPGMDNHNSDALYTFTVQGVLKQYERYLREFSLKRGRGVVVLDQREAKQDSLVLASAQSYLFSGHDVATPFARVIETPLLVPSVWYHGVQAADTVSRAIGALFRYRLDGDKAYTEAEAGFGSLIDGLTFVRDGWRSVFVKE